MKETNEGKFLIKTDFLDTRSYFLPANQSAIPTTYNQSKFVWCHSRVSIGKVCLRAKWSNTPEPIPGFRSMKRLGVFRVPPGWDASPSQANPQH